MDEERRLRLVLATVSAAAFMASLDLFIVNIAYVDIQRSLGRAGDATLSWILNGYTIVFASLPLVLGRLADQYGRRRAFMAGVGVFALGSALCAAAPSVGWLIGARVVQAAGAALLFPTSLGILIGEFPAERRPAAIAKWAAIGTLAAAAGPPAGGLLIQLSWHWIFIVNVPIAAVTLVVAARVIPESRAPAGEGRPDVPGAVVLVAGIAAVTLALVRGNDWGWGDGRTLALLAGGALLLVGFVLRCARHPRPVVDLALFTERRFAAANAAAFLFFAGFGGMLLAGALFLQREWGASPLEAAWQFAPGPAMAAVASFQGGKLVARYGHRAMGVAGAAFTIAGVAWLHATVGQDPAWLTEYLPGQLLTGLGAGTMIPTLAGAISSSLPPQRRATGSAVFATSRQLGTVLGVAVVVALLGANGSLAGFRHGWVYIGVMAAAAGAAAVAMGPRSVAVASSPVARPQQG